MLPTILTRFGFQIAQVLSEIPVLALTIILAVLTGYTWGAETTWRLPDQTRWKIGCWVGMTFLAWGILDWGLLAGLPALGFSYGAIGFSFTSLAVMRAGIFCVTAFFIKWGNRWYEHWRYPRTIQHQLAFLWLANLCLFALAGYSLYFEPFNLQTSQIAVPGPNFFPDRSLRVLQISDLHIERLTKREQLVLEEIAELQPDIIVLIGDYLNLDYLDDFLALAEARRLLAKLQAPYGVFAVNGSVDNPTRMQAIFQDLPIKVLDDQIQVVSLPGDNLNIFGISNYGLYRDRQALVETANSPDSFSLLLYHTPDLIENAVQAGVDVYLAGHTHGGQIRLPYYGAVVTFSIYGKQFESGAYQIEDTHIYISRGIGMEGFNLPRARFLCPPELVLIEIGGKKP